MNESQLGDDRSGATSPDSSVKNDKKKKVLDLWPWENNCSYILFDLICLILLGIKFNIPKIFSSKRRGRGGSDDDFASSEYGTISAGINPYLTINSKYFIKYPLFFFCFFFICFLSRLWAMFDDRFGEEDCIKEQGLFRSLFLHKEEFHGYG